MPATSLPPFCARRPGWILSACLYALLACAGLIATFSGSAITTTVERFDDSESARANALLRERALDGGGAQLPDETLIVRSDTLSVDDPAFRAQPTR